MPEITSVDLPFTREGGWGYGGGGQNVGAPGDATVLVTSGILRGTSYGGMNGNGAFIGAMRNADAGDGLGNAMTGAGTGNEFTNARSDSGPGTVTGDGYMNTGTGNHALPRVPAGTFGNEAVE